MYIRTFGWIQNPSDFNKLKRTVQIFDSESEHYKNLRDNLIKSQIKYFEDVKKTLQKKFDNGVESFNYIELVGSSKAKNGKSPNKRSEAEANALIQISIKPQRKTKSFSDNWTSDGFLRWAVSLNFVSHDRKTDLFTITKQGIQFSRSETSSEAEKKILIDALLRYPPATRVLEILYKSSVPRNKFYIGGRLGFRGEKGFTSYDEQLMTDWLKSSSSNPEQMKKIKTNIEGTSDKYARMICRWLEKLDLVKVIFPKRGTIDFQKYLITPQGQYYLGLANGQSKHKQVKKYIMWEFLATQADNRDYIRSRRAYILKSLKSTKSFQKLISNLRGLGFHDSEKVIKNDIRGLNMMGIRIKMADNTVILEDKLSSFTIPYKGTPELIKNEEILETYEWFMNNTNLPTEYLELLYIAYDGTRNRDFEIVTASLFKNVYKMNAILLGGGRKPDCLVFTDNFGIIIDTKAYSKGYPKIITESDKMIRYIEDNQRRDSKRNSTEWWKHFDEMIPSENFFFLWVSSKFIGRFPEQLDYTATQTNTNGGALNVEQLLFGAHAIESGRLKHTDFPKFFLNKEIFFN